MNKAYRTSVPDFLASRLEAKTALEGGSWQGVYRFAMWLGLIAIEDKGGLRRTMEAIGELPSGDHGVGRKIAKVPPEARELVRIAEREGVPSHSLICSAVICHRS